MFPVSRFAKKKSFFVGGGQEGGGVFFARSDYNTECNGHTPPPETFKQEKKNLLSYRRFSHIIWFGCLALKYFYSFFENCKGK